MITAYIKQGDGTMTLLEMGVADLGRRPFVTAAGQRYHALADLAAAHPALCVAQQLPLYCRICLHFASRGSFLPIDDADEFRRRHAALLAHAKAAAGQQPSIADFGPFDTSEIGPPHCGDGKLTFYVEDSLYGMPYRVQAPWPGQGDGVVRFLLLPLFD